MTCAGCLQAFPRLANAFRKELLGCITPTMHSEFLRMDRRQRMDALFEIFAEYAVQKHSRELQTYRWACSFPELAASKG